MQPQSISGVDLPKGKRTTLKLYVTSADAYEMWKADPENVTIIDVRTPEEFAFVGHAEMAWNVPFCLRQLSSGGRANQTRGPVKHGFCG